MLRRMLAVATVLLVSATAASAQYRYEVVHAFAASGSGPRTPSGPLLETADGSLYGTTPVGGIGNAGVIFQLLPDRSIITRDLSGSTAGNPYGGLIQTADGTLHGTTAAGGVNGSGTFFAITPSGTFLAYDLPGVKTNGQQAVLGTGPRAAPVLASDGNLYATVAGPTCCSVLSFFAGGIVWLTPQGGVAKLSVPSALNALNGPLVAGPGGYLYGTASGVGVRPSAFRFLPSSGQPEIIHTFTTAEAPSPGALVLGPDGNLYGAATGGIGTDAGTVFLLTPSGSVAVLHRFQDASEGAGLVVPLMAGRDGNLYGVTSQGGAFNAGAIFRISLTGDFSVIYSFTGAADGGTPLASLIEGRDGSLYGTASTGGPDGGGVVFRVKAFVSQPLVSIDIPGGGSITAPFDIGGWAIDRGASDDSGIDAVHVYVYPNPGSGAAPMFLGAAPLGLARPDISALYGPQFANAGWMIKDVTLPPGSYSLVAFAHSALTNAFDAVVTRAITVTAPVSQPILTLDSPAAGAVVAAGTRVFVGGWAIDQGASSGTGIDALHVWIIPNGGAGTPSFAGVATYGVSRQDIGAVFGARFTPSGYELDVNGLAPGSYLVAVFAHSTVTNTFVAVQTRVVTIQ